MLVNEKHCKANELFGVITVDYFRIIYTYIVLTYKYTIIPSYAYCV